jgi:hypothetical protein
MLEPHVFICFVFIFYVLNEWLDATSPTTRGGINHEGEPPNVCFVTTGTNKLIMQGMTYLRGVFWATMDNIRRFWPNK